VVTRVCEDVISNRFPFTNTRDREVGMTDFSRLFAPAPSGVMDTFFLNKLARFADLTGEEWKWREDGELAGRSLGVIAAFQRAQEIRDAFFPPGSPVPKVDTTFTQVSLNPNVDGVMLSVNGEVMQTQQEGNQPRTFSWPGAGGGGVTIAFTPPLPGFESSATVPGEWALMRLIKLNGRSRRGDDRIVTINVDGRDVVYQVGVSTNVNPFFIDFEAFSCPSGI
jgi:type VI secretion system protein ImpL